jgi:hypothetical protein
MTDKTRELAAEIIYYTDFHFVGGSKPEWVPNGNSIKQDEARKIANAILALAQPEYLTVCQLRGPGECQKEGKCLSASCVNYGKEII